MRGEARMSPTGLHPDDRAGARRAARGARGKAIVLLNSRGWSNFLSCRSCGRCGAARTATSRSCCTARAASWPATTAATASARPSAVARCGSTSVARHGAGTERLQHELGGRAGRRRPFRSSGSTPTPRRGRPRWRKQQRPRRSAGHARERCQRAAAAIRGGRVRRADRHADGRQGARLPRRRARRGARRRRDAALSGLPRRGAHVRADRAARRPRRARRRGERARADDRAARRARSRTPRVTTAQLPGRASSSVGGRSAIRPSRT